MIKHASIVPLIGGNTLASQNIFGHRPDYLLSYSPFKANDSHLVNYYDNEMPYILLDEGGKYPHKVDVVTTCCPCAGLSSLSPAASSESVVNEWMYRSAEYVLENVKPQVFWGENAPRLALRLGEPVVKRLRAIGAKNGYTFSIFKTRSILHGLSQIRDRTFYFFWKGTQIPIMDYIRIENHEKIEDTILHAHDGCAKDDPMCKLLTNQARPSDYPFYKYLLNECYGGMSHAEFAKQLKVSVCALNAIESAGKKYNEVAKWMRKNGFDREAKKADRMYHKLNAGGNIMRKHVEIPAKHIGAFVGHFPTMLTHPIEDRFLTVREALSIMKLPKDFQLVNPSSSLNHMCQNVPVTTAEHPARMVKKFLEGGLDRIETPFLIQDNKNQSIDTQYISSVSLDSFTS